MRFVSVGFLTRDGMPVINGDGIFARRWHLWYFFFFNGGIK